jgi:Flp pilus assembly protein TadG
MMPFARTHAARSPQRKLAALGLGERGQALVLFVLFLLVLLGASAIAIDYANWLLVDRRLQNIADHVALAGASAFNERDPDEIFTCASGKCDTAREQAWTAFDHDLDLGLNPAAITCLAATDTPQSGWASTNAAGCPGNVDFHHVLWVSTPPPGTTAYTGLGGRFPLQYSIVFARVDEATRTFFGGVFGITPANRIGWATAGSAPTAFALEIFCRDNILPETGVCENSEALAVDGQGGIRLRRGDIGSNQGLKVTANSGRGVIVENGQVFLVESLPCGPARYNCGTYPANTGGIANADPTTDSAPNWATGQTALQIPPLAVPHYPSPVDGGTDHTWDCSAAGTTSCVPNQPANSVVPGAWTCGPGKTDTYCGNWADTNADGVRDTCQADPTDPDLTPPMIPPGYYNSIEIPTGHCAILDPTAENQNWDIATSSFLGGLYPYQLAGIYQFDGDDTAGKKPRIEVKDDAALIGDGVTLVFDQDWPFPTGGKGITMRPTATFNINTYTIGGSDPPCTDTTEGPSFNQSGSWWNDDLPYSAVCAAWEVDPDTEAAAKVWNTCTDPYPCILDRDAAYDPLNGHRGITFYFTPKGNAWPPSDILKRYQMGGASGSDPGIGFRGILYAPYDDVKISGGNGFNTVGQVMAWSAKFNGGSAYIDLDYPYDYPSAESFLLEPTLGQ